MEVDRESRSRSRTPFKGEVVEMDNNSTSTTDATIRKTRRTEKQKPTNGLTNGAQNQAEIMKTTTTETETVTVTVNEIKAAKDSANKSKAKSTVKKVTEKKGTEKKVVEKDITRKKVIQRVETRDYSSDEDTKRTIDAYKAAGDWWEKFPKTDFTYSPASLQYKATVAPGVKALPNMSRRSLHSGDDRTDSAFTSSTPRSAMLRTAHNHEEFASKTAATYRTAPTLPRAPWSLSHYSDGESDTEEVTVTRTSTTTTTETTVWTRITTTTVTVFMYFYSWLSWMLDWLYLTVAYLRVLDARLLSKIPRLPQKQMLKLLALLVALAFVAWLFVSVSKSPGAAAIYGHWLLPIVATFRPVPSAEEGITASTVHAATPLPEWQLHQQATDPTLQEILAKLAALSEAVAKGRQDEAERIRRIVQDVGLEMETLRAKMEANWRRDDTARAAQSTELSDEQVDALFAKLSARLAADSSFSDKLSANGRFTDKLLGNGELVHKLIVQGELVQKLLVQGELTNKLVTSDELAARILADGTLAARLVSDGDLVERLLAKGELTSRILTNGDLVDRLSTDGELLAKLLANGRIVDRLLANGVLTSRLAAETDLADKLIADGNFASRLLENGRFVKLLLENPEMKARFSEDDIAKVVLGNGEFTENLLADGSFVKRLLENPEMKARFSEDEIAMALLGNGEFTEKLLADGGFVERLAADEKFVGLLATMAHASKDERVPELQDRLALLTASLEMVHQQVIDLQQTPRASSTSTLEFDGDVAALVAAMIARYDADKTGRTDYALESLGGSVLSTRCSETHSERSASISLFGLPLWTQASTPRAAIQPGTLPGQCWAFKGARGFLVVQLSGVIKISSVSIEHMPRSLSANDRIDSAPRRMTLLGLSSLEDPEPFHLGQFEFLEDGPSLQTFPVKSDDAVPAFRIVELQIESNHGNQEYTCLYRFRVHGKHVAV